MYGVILNLYIRNVSIIANISASNVSLFVRDAFTNLFRQCSLQWDSPMFSTANVLHYTVYTIRIAGNIQKIKFSKKRIQYDLKSILAIISYYVQ